MLRKVRRRRWPERRATRRRGCEAKPVDDPPLQASDHESEVAWDSDQASSIRCDEVGARGRSRCVGSCQSTSSLNHGRILRFSQDLGQLLERVIRILLHFDVLQLVRAGRIQLSSVGGCFPAGNSDDGEARMTVTLSLLNMDACLHRRAMMADRGQREIETSSSSRPRPVESTDHRQPIPFSQLSMVLAL